MVSIGKWLLFGLVGAFAISALVDPQRAFATTQAFKGVGGALGSLGGGVQSLFTGVGTGVAKLFNPLFTLRDLIYGPQAGLQTQTDVRDISSTGGIQTTGQEITQTQTSQILSPSQQAAGFRFSSQPSISPVPVAMATVHGQNLPMSAAAIAYYNALGVTPSPSSNETTSSQNTGNATSVSSASSNYSAGAAQAAGYSTGAPRGFIGTR
jgi:hypothetical protein